MKHLQFTFIVIAIVFIAQSCTKTFIEEIEQPTTGVSPEAVNYADHIEPIISNSCTTCHSGIAPSDGIDLTTYENVRQQSEFGNLINRINDPINPMPSSGLLSTSNRELFDHWSNNQFPEYQ
jgi:hypothetical protein